MINTQNYVEQGILKRKRKWLTITLVLASITVALSVLSLKLGNTIYSNATILKVLLGQNIKGASFAVVTLRLPRMLAGLSVGFAFGVAGRTFQTMLRNPLASPDIIGVTSGSSVAAVLCILVFNMSGLKVSLISVITGLLVALLIYLLSNGGGFSGGRLILIGIGIQAMLSAVISFLMIRANQYDVPAAMRWLSGSLNGIRLSELPLLLFVVVFFTFLITILGRHLAILELGEQSAIMLGLKANTIRILLVISSVFLIAFSTSVTGPIAFVSFLCGPIASKLVGIGLPNQIPSGLLGAILVLSADLIGQFAFSVKLPVGIITGILGAPYLIFLLVRMNQNGGTA